MTVFTIFADEGADFGRRAYLLDGDFRKVFPVGFEFHPVTNSVRLEDGTWVDKSSVYQGLPVDTANLPTKIKIGGGKKMPADLMQHSYFFVSDKLRQVIEGLEPDVHQFAPVELVWKDGKHAASYFWFYPCTRIDCMDREHTTHEFREKSGLWMNRPGGSCVVSLERVTGRHVWIDPRLSGRYPFVSEAFRQATTDAGIRGIGYNTMKAV
ncbi:DUF1629 domain-containing protein [Mesorhizobium sp. J428]|uniref:DUF1629 domain-containing protein n=1 Tax=Mesorhizobium sp. J428 TaxID=2898440 RepID=UPI00215168B5|nr:DUF1629 domain-containing protein [Mesorhizobium sp. J428]MCR5856442.1 DUF1629 domain-containing protein [Mesorhizobium sp. J428]